MPSVIGPADRPWRNLDPEAAPPAEIDIHLRHLRHLRIIFFVSGPDEASV
jgi:hypothetical protein